MGVLQVSTRLSLLTVCVVWIVTGNSLVSASSQAQVHQQCNFTLSVNSSLTLQQAITSISKYRGAGSTCVKIPAGRHILTSQILFPAEVEAIELVGLESNVNVACVYDSYENYTWYFDHLSSVTIRGIHFENCPRPLRLDTISNVIIQNCSFK